MGRLEFGVDYYPEQWEESVWEEDAARMAEYGFSVVRIMEFAWAVIEPEPSQYDFSLFDRAIETLARHGLKVIVGTPTATFPAWLAEKDPAVFAVSFDRRERDFGTRRNGCYNNTTYKDAAEELAKRIAARYGEHPAVAGFQVDNEVGHEGSDRCSCAICREAWRGWLERRYGTIEALNAAWGAVFWGSSLGSFGQVPIPRAQPSTQQSPQALLDYDRFCSDSAVAFIRPQLEALRAGADPEKWVTTNLFTLPFSMAIDMEALTAGMDFASWDNYPSWGSQDEPNPWFFSAFMLSCVRGLSGYGPFTVMEEMSGIQGHRCLGCLPPEGQVALWSQQAIARGANRVIFFRWRTAPFGQEQLCHGLFDADNRETDRARAIRLSMEDSKRRLARIAETEFESRACVVYSKDDARVLREQYLSEALFSRNAEWMQGGYDIELARWFAPYALFGVNADVKSVASVDLARYKIISLPLYQMADPAFVAKLDAWVRSGGVLVLGYRAGTRDLRDWNVRETLPGLFRDMAGMEVRRFESLNKTEAGLRIGIIPAKGAVWADIIKPLGASVVARWVDGKKYYSGSPCVTVNDHGEGKVWYIGTSPNPTAIFFLYKKILSSAGLHPRYSGLSLEVIERRSPDGERIKLVLNHSRKAAGAFGKKIAPWGMEAIFEKDGPRLS